MIETLAKAMGEKYVFVVVDEHFVMQNLAIEKKPNEEYDWSRWSIS